MTTPFRPLEGITVLDLSRYLPGPFLTRILADMGAKVIKVEPPTGEGLRWMPPRHGKMGMSFASLNAGKQSVAVDLKKPEGQALVRALAAKADILVEGFRPGVLARLGLDWASLQQDHPQLIGVSLSGYGQTGPRAQVAGHDLNYVAVAGVLGMFGPAGQPPLTPAVQMADVAGGTLPAAIGVLGALLDRARTGKGRHLDIALAKGVFGFATFAMAQAAHGVVEARGAGVLTGGAPCCRCYATSDGRHVAYSALEPHFYDRFCELVAREDLKGTAYALGEEAERIAAQWSAIFGAHPLAHWEALAEGEDVCLEAVRTPDEAVADPYFAGIVKDAGGYPVIQMPIGVAPTDLPDPAPPSQLGADTATVLREQGIDPAMIERARAAGAVTLPDTETP